MLLFPVLAMQTAERMNDMKSQRCFPHKMQCLFVMLFTYILITISTIGLAATLDEEHFVVGGVGLDSTPEYVESIYGTPDNIKLGHGPFGDVTHWYYGSSFSIGFLDGVATYIDVTDKNGIKTIDGIQVGDTRVKVEQTYGQPTRFNYFRKEKCYQSWYLMTNTKHTYMIFTFDIRQKIIRYSIFLVDG